MRTHEGKIHLLSCITCNLKFIRSIDIERHQVKAHNAESEGMTRCAVCGELIEDKSLSGHKKAIHVLNCDLCNLKFVQKFELWRHMIEEHQQGTWIKRPVTEMPEERVKPTKTVQNLTVDKAELIDESTAKLKVHRLTVGKRGAEQSANQGA